MVTRFLAETGSGVVSSWEVGPEALVQDFRFFPWTGGSDEPGKAEDWSCWGVCLLGVQGLHRTNEVQ